MLLIPASIVAIEHKCKNKMKVGKDTYNLAEKLFRNIEFKKRKGLTVLKLKSIPLKASGPEKISLSFQSSDY